MASGHGGLHPQTMSQDNPFLPLAAYIRYSVMATRRLFLYLPGMLFCVMYSSVGCAVIESGPRSDEHQAFFRQICFLGPPDSVLERPHIPPSVQQNPGYHCIQLTAQ